MGLIYMPGSNIPIITPPPPPPKCPQCGQNENIKRICANCGHEYKYKPTTFWEGVGIFCIVIGITLAIVFIIFVFVVWAVETKNRAEYTLIDSTVDCWHKVIYMLKRMF